MARCDPGAPEPGAPEPGEESPWDQLTAGLALGSEEFVNRIRGLADGVGEREQPTLRRLRDRSMFGAVMKVVEVVKGEEWQSFRDRYGDWGRDLALYMGRRRCLMSLCELGEAAGDLDYGSVSEAVRRFGRRLEKDSTMRDILEQAEARLLKIET